MQNAETVLGVLRERGRRGLPCNQLYRQLFNPHLYLLAYGRLYSNQGAMTPGVDGETVDGMSQAKIGRIIDALRHERYRFQPVKRIYIPKKERQTQAARPAVVVGQTRQRGSTSPAGGILRATVFRPVSRLPSRKGLSHRTAGSSPDLDRDHLVHRIRYRPVFRPARPHGHARNTGREDTR